MLLYCLCLSHAVSLEIASLAQSTLSAMIAGEDSQIHQYKLCMFSRCVVLQAQL